tara:strand:+ start:131 stop:595 length:465 start_codon:yes stop_codon:yes gene_type:complete
MKTVNEKIRARVRKLYEDNGGPGGGSSGCNAACEKVVATLEVEEKIEKKKGDKQRRREEGKVIATTIITIFGTGVGLLLVSIPAGVGVGAATVVGVVSGVGSLITEVAFNVGSEGGLIDAGLVKNTAKMLVDPIIPGGGTVITEGVKAVIMGWF